MKDFLKKLATFILYGFVFWLPVILVIYVTLFFFSNGEKVGSSILGVVVPDRFLYTGLGFLFCILIVLFSGIILKRTKIGGVLSRIPFVGIFFGQGEIMTIGRLSHMQACLFLYSPTCISYGWILSEEKVKINEVAAGFPIINVYFPNVPTLVTGQVLAARKDTVMKIANPSTEVINLLLYAFRSPAALRFFPWEDESREQFEERSKLFGLK